MSTEDRRAITLDDMPPGTVASISGNPFPQFKGLLYLAHQEGLSALRSDLISYAEGEAVVKAYAEGSRGTYEAHGDASPDNVPRGAASEVVRRAETRACSRALRWYLGIGDCAADELAPERPQDAPRPRKGGSTPPQTVEAPTGPSRGEQVARSIVQGAGDPECPRCQSRVWDNREQRRQQQAEHDAGRRQSKPGPAWKCSNKQCTGSRNGDPWVGWRADFFGVQGPPPVPAQTAQEQPPPLDPVACGLDERGESFTADQEIPF